MLLRLLVLGALALTACAQQPQITLTRVPTITPSPLPPTPTADTSASTPSRDVLQPVPPDFAEQIAAADPAEGETLFNQTFTLADGALWSCAQCHSITPDEMRLIGPGMWNLNSRFATYALEMDLATYLYESLVAPDLFIQPPGRFGPYQPGLMPSYSGVLDEAQMAALSAYLLTLGE